MLRALLWDLERYFGWGSGAGSVGSYLLRQLKLKKVSQ